jgi:hypothetical protein
MPARSGAGRRSSPAEAQPAGPPAERSMMRQSRSDADETRTSDGTLDALGAQSPRRPIDVADRRLEIIDRCFELAPAILQIFFKTPSITRISKLFIGIPCCDAHT